MDTQKRDVIALVGAGAGGTAILSTLLRIPEVEIRYVVDILEDAPGMVLARRHGIKCLTGSDFTEIVDDPDVELIFEVTGNHDIFWKLRSLKRPSCGLLGANGTRIIFHLLNAQNMAQAQLRHLMEHLESAIVKRTEELELANIELRDTLNESKRLNDKLQQVNDEKTKYLLQATHQLKAPFAAIQSYVDLMLEGFAGNLNPQVADIVAKIKCRCEMLAGSINDMLELSNLKSCLVENLKMTAVDLNRFAPAVIETFVDVASHRGITLNFKSGEGNLNVYGNEGQLKIMLAVLIDNAVNYSYDNSQVTVSVARLSSAKALVSVEDQGIGIPKENLGKIFQEYFRSNNAVKHHQNGSGLGLSIVQEIVRIHNFSLEVKSTIGKGSTFAVIMTTV